MLRVWLTTAPTTRDGNINYGNSMTKQEQGDLHQNNIVSQTKYNLFK